MVKKLAIYKIAPPGSGKSHLDNLIFKNYNIKIKNTYIINIDPIIINDPEYTETKKLCKKIVKQKKKYKKFPKKIFYVCKNNYLKLIPKANKIIKENYNNAIKDNKNIIFEDILWNDKIFIKQILELKKLDYIIIGIVPVVLPINILEERVFIRAGKTGMISPDFLKFKYRIQLFYSNLLKVINIFDEFIMFDNINPLLFNLSFLDKQKLILHIYNNEIQTCNLNITLIKYFNKTFMNFLINLCKKNK